MNVETSQEKVINLAALTQSRLTNKCASTIGWLIEPVFCFEGFNRVYNQGVTYTTSTRNFFDGVLHGMGTSYTVSAEDLKRIPLEGPVVVIANHPFGGLDGVILGSILSSIRPDFKLLVNYLLHRLGALQPYTIPVDPFAGSNATQANIKPLKDTIRWLRQGGVIGTFPAGTVSHVHVRKSWKVTDPTWNANTATLIRKTGATVVPLFFEGRNSTFFNAAGLLHPRLRTICLPRELCNKTGKTINVRIGKPITARSLEGFNDDQALIDHLRLKTYVQANREQKSNRKLISFPHIPLKKQRCVPLIPAVPPETLEAEVKSLPEGQLLTSSGDFKVMYAQARQIPQLLREIGRLREETFRAVGEGTGKELDLDRYDDYYLHLFMWNEKEREIVGAYRLGLTDEILSQRGRSGLYTASLFRLKSALLDHLAEAIELGRSFISIKYQRKHASLALIWRGIGEFIARHPQYGLLFGPVSISKDYQSLSKNLMVRFLRQNNLDPDLSSLVRAKRPPRNGRLRGLDKGALVSSLRDIDDVSALISEIEEDQKGIPILLKHYLKLNGTILSFNVDQDFSDVIDGLIMVDLQKTDSKIMQRYMGEKGFADYMDYQNQKSGEKQAVLN